MARGKRYREAYEKIDRTQAYPPAEAIHLIKETAGAKFDETVELHIRLGVNVRHAEEQLRGTLALPEGPRQERHDRRLRRGRCGPPGQRGRRGLRRLGRPRRAGRGRLDRLRRGDRPPLADAEGRQARPGPRPAGQDAESQGRHGHGGHRQGRRGGQGRQGRVPDRSAGDRPPGDRQDQLLRDRPARELRGGDRGDHSRQARGRQGPLHPLDHREHHDGPGHPDRPEPYPPRRDHAGRRGGRIGGWRRRRRARPPSLRRPRRRRRRRPAEDRHPLHSSLPTAAPDRRRDQVQKSGAGERESTGPRDRQLWPACVRVFSLAARGPDTKWTESRRQQWSKELAEELKDAKAIFAVDYRGISVPQAAELRDGLRDADTRFRVVKNRLTLRAADEAGTDVAQGVPERARPRWHLRQGRRGAWPPRHSAASAPSGSCSTTRAA